MSPKDGFYLGFASAFMLMAFIALIIVGSKLKQARREIRKREEE